MFDARACWREEQERVEYKRVLDTRVSGIQERVGDRSVLDAGTC